MNGRSCSVDHAPKYACGLGQPCITCDDTAAYFRAVREPQVRELSMFGLGRLVNLALNFWGAYNIVGRGVVFARAESVPSDSPLTDALSTRWEGKADHRVWTSTYWPYSNFADTPGGDPSSNLWADGGPLAKFDLVLATR